MSAGGKGTETDIQWDIGTVPFFAENNCPLKNNQNCLLKTYQYLAMISANQILQYKKQ